MRSSRKGLTVEETIAERYSDPFSDTSDLESSNAEWLTVVYQPQVSGKYHSLFQ